MKPLERTTEFLNRDTVARLSALFGETGGASAARQQSWTTYDRLPFPTHEDEAWRRTDISFLDFGRFEVGADLPRLAEECPLLFNEVAPAEGKLFIHDDVMYRQLPPEVESRGILFMDLASALKNHKELVEKFLFNHVGKPVHEIFCVLRVIYPSRNYRQK